MAGIEPEVQSGTEAAQARPPDAVKRGAVRDGQDPVEPP